MPAGSTRRSRGSISFGPGVTTRQFSIALINPGRNLQGDQTVDLTLSNPTGGATLGVYPTATLTLHDTSQTRPGDLDPAFGTRACRSCRAPAPVGPSVITLQPDGKFWWWSGAGEVDVVASGA